MSSVLLSTNPVFRNTIYFNYVKLNSTQPVQI